MSNPVEVYVAVKEEAIRKSWAELVKVVHHAFAYGLECNDMTHGEVEEDIAFALDKFARENGLMVHDWDAGYEEIYGESRAED